MGLLDDVLDFLFKKNEEPEAQKDGNYNKKQSLVTNKEMEFYKNLEDMFGSNYKVQTQINLASVVDKTLHSKYRSELFRNIDFGIFDKESLKPLVLIELNDKTHKNKDRYERDLKVRDILKQSGIPLLTFYTNMPNEYDYVYERINKELKKYKTGILRKLFS